MENQSRSKVNRTSRITRRVRRGQLDKAYYPPIFWAVIGLVCVFGFYHGYQKLQHNTAVKRADAIQSKLEIDMVSKPKVRAEKKNAGEDARCPSFRKTFARLVLGTCRSNQQSSRGIRIPLGANQRR
jgi:hypothetical protein